MKTLLLEDNERLSKLIKESLKEKNYRVDWFDNGKIALEHIYDGYDCFILDINVPGVDGLTLLAAIKDMNEAIPCIIISANVDLETIKEAYCKGCSEYLKKPFYIYELETKVEKLCRNNHKKVILNEMFFYEIQTEKLYNGNEEVKLSKKEILLLNLFVKYKEHIITFEQIEQYVWEGALTSMENIRALVKRVRKKLPKETIVSQGGMGYKLEFKEGKREV